MAMRMPLLAAALSLALACVPKPGGQCAADADCLGGTTCQAGLCRAEPACAQPCGDGLHCAAGLCAPTQAPSVGWLVPDDGSARAGGRIDLALAVTSSAVPREVRVILQPARGGLFQRFAVVLRFDGANYRGDLDTALLGEDLFDLTPLLLVGDTTITGPSRSLRIDRTPPAIELLVPSPAGEAFRRDESITIRARVTDGGAGVDRRSLALIADGMPPLAGQQIAPETWAFRLPLAKPTFAAIAGPLPLRVIARDLAGNQGAAVTAVPVTRVLWRAQLGAGLPLRSSPTIDRAHVYVGTDGGQVFALDRPSGVALWSRQLSGAVSAGVARGKQAVYAASEGGDVVALEPATGALRWTCADLSGTARFAAAPAVTSFPGLAAAGVSAEGVVLVNATELASGSYGGVLAVEGSAGFPLAGKERSCALVADLGGGATSASIGADGAIFVGTRGAQGRLARKLRAGPDAAGSWSLREEWAARLGDDPSGAPALGADGSVAFADAGGQIARLDAAGAALWSPPAALGEKLVAAPIIAFTTLLAQGRDGTLAPFALGPPLSGQTGSPAFVAQQLGAAGDVDATPAVGADGTIYAAAGRSLRALSPGGAVLWEAPLAGGATASSPTLGCDGALYVGDGAGELIAVATDSPGLAPGWPRLGHDARGTGNATSPLCE